ncbi:hypothetical protein HanXRQr2_Chr08g0348851 [Helianthus annuus]|uniref:Uncharacterized protein n=1 Tax=Helianthus annuus TaxID=4232 RepID=A0A9K3IGR2_HELAN|nr:hypothetical protein HanXRQr2_Chr08g0348851 [Helianthus annuus]KAJ0902451.1 hypothetical protein HanPSC8_Chr08g0337181 [Helianthus annuus]
MPFLYIFSKIICLFQQILGILGLTTFKLFTSSLLCSRAYKHVTLDFMFELSITVIITISKFRKGRLPD